MRVLFLNTLFCLIPYPLHPNVKVDGDVLLLKKIVASLIRQERTSIASLMIFSMVRAPYKIVCLLITPPGGLWDYLQITDGRTEPEK